MVISLRLRRLFSCIAILLFWPFLASASFSDVEEDDPYREAIEWAESEKLVSGYPDGTFRSGDTIKRGELIKIAVGAYFLPSERNICDPHHIYHFPDAGYEEWYSSYLCSAVTHHIIGGYPDGSVRLAQSITFGEAAKVIGLSWNHLSHLNENNVPFPAETGGPWYEVYIKHLENNAAVPPSVSGPGHPLTRGEMVYIMYRLGSRVTAEDYWKTYTDAGKNFSIDFPSDWMIRDHEKPTFIENILSGKHRYGPEKITNEGIHSVEIGVYTTKDLRTGETWIEFAKRQFPEIQDARIHTTDYGKYTQHYFIPKDEIGPSYQVLEEGGTALVLFFGSNSTFTGSLRGTVKYLK